MIVRDSYVAGLRKVVDGAMRTNKITPERRQYWDGYRQALDDIVADASNQACR